jgi:hypothetical protein
MPGAGVAGQLGDHRREQPCLPAQPLAVPGLPWQIWEHRRQILAGVADPPPFAGDAQQLLGSGQAQQLAIVQRRLASRPAGARPAQRRQHAVGEFHVKCGQEGVQVVRHKTILGALRLTFRAATRTQDQ